MSSNDNLVTLDKSSGWRFFAEGNAHILFRHCTEWTGWLLRIRKVSSPALQSIDSDIIVRQLFGFHYAPLTKSVQIKDEFVDHLVEQFKVSVPGRSTSAQFIEDCVWPQSRDPLDSIAVEIKPKWAYKDTNDFDHCRYCRQQCLKLGTGQISEVSSYCPLDLFSRDTNRICGALQSLIYIPQNNLKVFVNGQCIEVGTYVQFAQVVTQEWNLACVLQAILESDDILDLLKSAQVQLKDYTLVRASQAFTQISQRQDDLDTLQQKVVNLASYFLYTRSAGDDADDNYRSLAFFLLGKALKDLSILINISRAAIPGLKSIQIDGQAYWYAIKIVDVDLKPASKIASYIKQDLEINQAYSKVRLDISSFQTKCLD
ncbi:hypothetical protein MIR68_012164 [Amoeboaphelidium protococcarum]|nr:hypothetical protein MIR68_012164 [Amoeboaphelidium protococcarum]